MNEFLQKGKAWLIAHKSLAIFIAIVLFVGIILAIVLPLTVGNIFRAGKVEKISFGDDYAKVEKILGKPNEATETVYKYYSKNVVKKMQQLQNLEKNMEDLMMSDKAFDEDAFEKLLNKASELQEEIDKMEYKLVSVSFSEGEVTSVVLDTHVNGDANEVKWQENSKKQKIEISPKEIPSDFTPEMLQVSAQIYYDDGSYKMSRINPSFEGQYSYVLTWSDSWGEYSAEIKKDSSSNYYKSYSIVSIGSGKSVLQIHKSVLESDMRRDWDDYADVIVAVYLDSDVKYVASDAFDKLTKVSFERYENGIYLSGLNSSYQFLWKTETTDFTSFKFHSQTEGILGKAFSNCENLTDITIPYNVTSIGEQAFYNCPNLENVVISNQTNYIATNAFYQCPNIKYNETENAKYLASTSNDCYALVEVSADATEFTLPVNCKLILSNSFSKCDKLETIYWNAETYVIPGVSYDTDMLKSCSNLSSVVIGNTVTELTRYTFDGCSADISWEENAQIKTIATFAFNGYLGTSITIPDSVTKIETYAFSVCKNLTSVVLGSGLREIEKDAFSSCEKVTSVTFANPDNWRCGPLYDTVYIFSASELSDPATAAEYLTETYIDQYWRRSR